MLCKAVFVLNNPEQERVYCKRCGKVLKDEYSRSIGYGPKCFQIYLRERNQHGNRLFEVGEEHEATKK